MHALELFVLIRDFGLHPVDPSLQLILGLAEVLLRLLLELLREPHNPGQVDHFLEAAVHLLTR